ncbi:hypothetical protein GGR54DRAFT_171703 [Hypoxylon sp. NC1633]|nr:hypothetical protein GGR54DRAFT_171703 [Hypoxylon sp. NC1633]
MADKSYVSASTSAANTTGRTSSIPGSAPPGFGLRRAATVGQPLQTRRHSTLNSSSPTGESGFADIRRRSSTYSDFSLGDARKDLEASADDLLNPSKSGLKVTEKSPFVYVPLTIALLPAVAGIFFENGSAFFTDLILLSLAAVFLHWSVTQPWDWYHSAQEVRIVKDEIMNESVFESDSDTEPVAGTANSTTLEDVPEEAQKQSEPEVVIDSSPNDRRERLWKERQAAALYELYLHEMAALAWCFIFPMLAAYLLHTIRGQLSRPSEGLVSDYNLTIFLCAAEIRPVSHLMKMLQSRTLRVQQTVASNPHEKQTITTEQFETLCGRLNDVESRNLSHDTSNNPSQPNVSQVNLVEAAVAREVRNSIQPELDALNRAMRRYEKKLTLLACQTDNRIEYVDCRLSDAIALAAVAAKNSNAQWGLGTWLIDTMFAVVMLPVQAAMAVLTFPFRTVSTLLSRKSRSSPEKYQKTTRNGKAPVQGRSSSDRVPTRVSKR